MLRLINTTFIANCSEAGGYYGSNPTIGETIGAILIMIAFVGGMMFLPNIMSRIFPE
jgi:hypothetical protein